MSDGLTALIHMAQRGARVHELQSQLNRIPARLAEARKQLDSEQKLLDELANPWQAMEAAIASKDSTVKLALETIEKFEAHMKRVNTQKEYIAAKKQVDEARKLNEKLQNEILELRVKQEELTPKLKDQQEQHARVAEEYRKVEAQMLQEQSALQAQLKEEEGALRRESSAVAAPVLPYYERLTKGGRFPAIVPVHNGKCTGCNIALPPQTFNQLLAKNGTLFTCPNCRRVIYHPPEERQAEPEASGDAAGPAGEPEPVTTTVESRAALA